jgi:hypothetical protein
MSGPVEVILILAAVCYIMARRMIGEPAQAKRMLILPAVLLVIGLSQMSGDTQSVVSIGFLVATGGISVVIGALRGASVRVSERDGLAFVLGVVDHQAAASVSNSLFLTLGAGMLVEGLVALARALRTDSRVAWSKGDDGEPHKMSPFLDDLQGRLSGGARGTDAEQPNPRQGGTLSSLAEGLRDARRDRRR